jgi:predicted DNA-binding protein YlxM (UPF0122 family)
VNSLALTEKQQQVVWLRYGRRASIRQIAEWLQISRRSVLTRLRNARQRAKEHGTGFGTNQTLPALEQKMRVYSASQISNLGRKPLQLDDL